MKRIVEIRLLHLSLLTLFFLIWFNQACRESEKKLTRSERALVDSLIVNQRRQLEPLWDSLCVVVGDSMFSHSFDSIYAVRLAEIESILNSSR